MNSQVSFELSGNSQLWAAIVDLPYLNREMKFLLGQRLFNNIFCANWIISYPWNNQENEIKKKNNNNKIN